MAQIPEFCRTFTGRTHDLPYIPANMPEYAGIYRPNDRPGRHPQGEEGYCFVSRIGV
jgi:hypothetical protein